MVSGTSSRGTYEWTEGSVFDLAERLTAKAEPALIDADVTHFAAIGRCLRETIDELTERLDAERRAPGRSGTEAVVRDEQVHRLVARLRTLRRFGLDVCLGRIVRTGDPEPVYIGRIGLTDRQGRQLLIDWRSPNAEPFFGATHANPEGLLSRRRYRWARGRITDYWDEVFDPDGLVSSAALDDQSAFIASLGAARSPQMRDVLGTIQADQDTIIRASSRGPLVVDGGPGTGKTVVALHRTAYLLYADPRLGHHRGGVLFVGPHQPYLAYVADVLPSLGEEGVQTCTLLDLVTEGAIAVQERDPAVAALKSTAEMVDAIEAAVRFHEQPPTTDLTVDTPWADFELTARDWAEAFAAVEPGIPHNEARAGIVRAVVDRLVDRYRGDVPTERLRVAVGNHRGLRAELYRAWPLVEAADLIADLWSVPAYLRWSAPHLDRDQVRLLQRPDPKAWTVHDLPLLDAARRRLGDPEAAARKQRRRAAEVADRARMGYVVDDLVAAHEMDDGDGVLIMLREPLLATSLVDSDRLPDDDPDASARSYAHVVVDEAQELTDAQWRMVLARCPSQSLTIVGDRAQARHGFTENWTDRLTRVGFDRLRQASLTINYRTPAEIMAEAAPVILAVLPDANIPTSVRHTGVAVGHRPRTARDAVVQRWLAAHPDGTACVIGDPDFSESPRVRSLTPVLAKGLEFDLVVLVEPDRFNGEIHGDTEPDVGSDVEAAVDRYVSMTRATQELVILRSD
jgi:hypothetical protein